MLELRQTDGLVPRRSGGLEPGRGCGYMACREIREPSWCPPTAWLVIRRCEGGHTLRGAPPWHSPPEPCPVSSAPVAVGSGCPFLQIRGNSSQTSTADWLKANAERERFCPPSSLTYLILGLCRRRKRYRSNQSVPLMTGCFETSLLDLERDWWGWQVAPSGGWPVARFCGATRAGLEHTRLCSSDGADCALQIPSQRFLGCVAHQIGWLQLGLRPDGWVLKIQVQQITNDNLKLDAGRPKSLEGASAGEANGKQLSCGNDCTLNKLTWAGMAPSPRLCDAGSAVELNHSSPLPDKPAKNEKEIPREGDARVR